MARPFLGFKLDMLLGDIVAGVSSWLAVLLGNTIARLSVTTNKKVCKKHNIRRADGKNIAPWFNISHYDMHSPW
jgi:hypothetical protein